MLYRVLEPEVMDTEKDAAEYNAISNNEVNIDFVEKVLEFAPGNAVSLIDLGSGPAQIPILFATKAPNLVITALELAESMIELAHQNIQAAGMSSRITVEKQDIKSTTLPKHSFDIVVSNSCIHHMHNPVELFREAKRLVSKGGLIYFKDLLRPNSFEELKQLVDKYAYNDSDYQKTLFYNSLHASLTLDEIRANSESAGLSGAEIIQTSDRHWVLIYNA